MKVESKEKTIKERNQSNGHGSSFVVLYILFPNLEIKLYKNARFSDRAVLKKEEQYTIHSLPEFLFIILRHSNCVRVVLH